MYVVDARDRDSAAYLVERLGCERISRAQAIDIDRVHRHTGKGSAWAVGSYGNSGPTLTHQIDAASAATRETIAYYRAMDESAGRE